MHVISTLVFGFFLVHASNCQMVLNEKLVNSINDFSLAFYKKVKENDNLICSGYSVHCVMNLLLAGARANTSSQIANALRYVKFKMTEDEIPTAYRDLLDMQDADHTGYELDVANSVWIQSGYPVSPNFTSYVKRNFNVEERQIDFSQNSAKDEINQWVAEKTKGRIQKLFYSPFDPLTVLVLANAIYFKGTWERSFNKNLTNERDFWTGNNTKQVPMMKTSGYFNYNDNQDLNAQILELPYIGDDVSMVIVLPKSQNGLDNLENEITISNLNNAIGRLRNWRKVHVKLPKFSISSKLPLNSVLQALGIVDAFNAGNADFSGITDGPRDIYVTESIQKADIEVNEEGTIAIAVSGIRLQYVSSRRPPEFFFTADHPFFFMIRQKSTGIILFCGRVISP